MSKTIIGINKNGGLYIFPRFYDEENAKENNSNYKIYYGCTTQSRNVFSCELKILYTTVGDIDFFVRKVNDDTIGVVEVRYVKDNVGKRSYVFSARLLELKKVGPWDEKINFKTISERNKYPNSLIEMYGGSNYESIVSDGKCK